MCGTCSVGKWTNVRNPRIKFKKNSSGGILPQIPGTKGITNQSEGQTLN